MLDPFTALSLASSVIQIVDFGSELVSKAEHIRRDGSLVENKELELVAKDLQSLNQNVVSCLRHSTPLIGCMTKDQNALEALAIECSRVADELIDCLSSVHRKSCGRSYGSFRQALQTIWKKKKIEEIVSRLDNFRIELVLRILVSMKINDEFRTAREDARFDNLTDSSRAVADSILHNQNFFTTGLQEIRDIISERNCATELEAERRHAETIAAISTLQDRDSDYMWNGDAIPRLDGVLSDKKLRTLELIQSQVLECLRFKRISERHRDIAEAHQKTFQWIYQRPKSDRWTDFEKWLETGSGCYWINGKAGSGKSTIMKYISGNSRTKSLLLKWADDTEILCASFFFWNAGSSMQKSQLGLLRSLLYDSMSKFPSLISIVFPGLCRAVSYGRTDIGEPSLFEMKEAFSLLTRQNVLPLKMCFLIDGIDEFDGDHYDLAQNLRSVCSSSVKFVLSSRPTPLCVEAFFNCPSLQLQDLTEPDILRYVEDKLTEHYRMKVLIRKDPVEAYRLLKDIVSKASGVFLWIILVVKSLLDGLRSFDRLDDLRKRLEELPPDLNALYNHMLGSMSPLYRQQASRLLQIVYQNSRAFNAKPITTLRLSFADEDNPKTACEADFKELTLEEKQLRCVEMEGRVRSRCCGLLEIHGRKLSNINSTHEAAEFDPEYSVVDILSNHGSENVLHGEANLGSYLELKLDSAKKMMSEGLPEEWLRQQIRITANYLENLARVDDRSTFMSTPLEAFCHTTDDSAYSDFDSRKEDDTILLGLSDEELSQYATLMAKDKSNIVHSEIDFLHKSVIDFLEQSEIWESLTNLTSTSKFDPNVALASSSLLEAKFAPAEVNVMIDTSLVWSFLFRGLTECIMAEISTKRPQTSLLDGFDNVMAEHWRKIRGWQPRYGLPFNERGHWSNMMPFHHHAIAWPHGGPPCDSMLSVAASLGLELYVEQSLRRISGKRQTELAQSILNRVISDIDGIQKSEIIWNGQISVIALSIKYGANTNSIYHEGRSPWLVALWRCSVTTLAIAEGWSQILEILLDGGADPNAAYVAADGCFDGKYNVRVIQSALTAIIDKLHEVAYIDLAFVRPLFEHLREKAVARGGLWKQWVEKERANWTKTAPMNKWERVTDSEFEVAVLKDFGFYEEVPGHQESVD